MSFIEWKPIHCYLYFDRFPDCNRIKNIFELHHLIYTLFKFYSFDRIQIFLNRVLCLYVKRSLRIDIYECENQLFVLKRKFIFEPTDKTPMICILGINSLKKDIPNFLYTYYFRDINSYSFQSMEHVNGITLKKFLTNLFLLNSESLVTHQWTIFLQIFLQILFCLEFAQQRLHFTHYDLHTQNILIKLCNQPQTIIYPCDRFQWTLKNLQYVVKIIDFEFSTLDDPDSGKIISNIYESVFSYGFFSVYLPGMDMLRIIFELRYLPKYDSFLGEKIDKFLDYIIFNFYKIYLSPDQTYENFLHKKAKTFFNFTLEKNIFTCPYEIFQFLEKDLPTEFLECPPYDSNIETIPIYSVPCIDEPLSSIESFLQKYKERNFPKTSQPSRMIYSVQCCLEQKKKYKLFLQNPKLSFKI